VTDATPSAAPSAATPQSAASPIAEPVRLGSVGPLTVGTEACEVAAFRAETGWAPDVQEVLVPHTFPMRWLSLLPVKSVIEDTIKSLDAVAFHESQNFVYERPLARGETYQMSVTLERHAEPARLVIQAQITRVESPKEAAPVLTMETILRLVFAGAPT